MTELSPVRCTECPIRDRALFQVLSQSYLDEAGSRRAGQYRVAARTHLYQESAPAAMAFTLFEGWLLLYRNHADGSRQGLRVALPGDFVGYAPLSEAGYSHGALAVTDVVVCGFRQADLHEMITSQSVIARQVSSIQARNLALCESNVLGLGRKSAEQRIAHLVADLHHRLTRAVESESGAIGASDAAPPLIVPFPLTQEMLGELAGLTPVHTNRVLRKLRLDGVMTCERHRLEIMDLVRLHQIAGFQPA
jgi:CRP/FNR family transcriptional regulator, anaerobic regulatory protein